VVGAMRYTKREQRLAGGAAVLVVVALVVLGLVLVRGAPRPRAAPTGKSPPPASASASPTPEQSAPTGVRVLTARYEVRGRWKGGFNAELVVTNLGAQPVEGWTVELRMPHGVRVTDAWSADLQQAAGRVTLRSQPWNTYVGPGGTVHLGFQATGDAAAPSGCTVNLVPC
jgi:cellulase/cellobiase CelA1